MYKYLLIVYIFANVLLVSAQAQEGYDVPRLPVPIEIEDQPIPFSHELHSSIGLQCATCHIGSEDGRSMTLPISGTCVGCHSVIATERESIQTLLTYHDLGEVIPWVRIYAINEGITWNHQVHLDANLSCQTCHGPVQERSELTLETGVIAMSSCIGCHQANEAEAECYTCHAWPTPDVIEFDHQRYLPQ